VPINKLGEHLDTVTPQNLLMPSEDGLTIRKFGPWTKEKLYYIEGYLKIISVAMKNQTRCDLNYIDLFCGSGKCKIEEPFEIVFGSPLIALSLENPFSNLFFADKSHDNIAALQQRCSKSNLFDRIHFYEGDSNQKVHEIISDIEFIEKSKGKTPNSSLNCAFLDPDGLELDWETIETLAKLPKMGLIIFYPQNAIDREFLNEINIPPPTRIDKYLGSQEWRQLIINYQKKPPRFHRTLIDMIKSSLKPFGYLYLKDRELEPLIRMGKKKAPFYRLIYASKNDLGEKFWKATIKEGPDGQKSWC